MPLPTNRTTANTAAEHVADHNALHAEYNTPTHTHSATRVDAKVYRAAAYNVPNAAVTAIPWDTEEFDNGGFWASGAGTRLTVPSGQGGLYEVGYCIGTDANFVDQKRWITGIQKNGADIRGARVDISVSGVSNPPTNSTATIVELAAADYIESWVYQDSGSTKNLFLAHSVFWCRKVT